MPVKAGDGRIWDDDIHDGDILPDSKTGSSECAIRRTAMIRKQGECCA